MRKKLPKKKELHQSNLKQKALGVEESKRRNFANFRTILEFGPLTKKYNVPMSELWDRGSLSPLSAILIKLEASEQLEDWEMEWLEDRNHHRLIATILYRKYKSTGDPWRLVNTLKYLRKANLPEKAISLSENILATNIRDKRVLSALWTTRGGAFRDLNDLQSAKYAAATAIQESPSSYHPHNLMGAILYEEGFPEEGDKHLEEAIKLGSTLRDQDSEIRSSIDKSTPEARRRVIDYLLSKDPNRYSWVLQISG